ncbi:MAG: D-lyxose/D-mannose family sugar isomerase [Anaerolineae bacterium]|nr:D-lyxose/D-mannose family sugar isomerase [Anaerolineae bacterium]
MITRREYDDARRFAWDLVRQSGIAVQDADFENLEVADLGLSELPVTGAQILTLASTQFLGVKALVLRPNQFFPQHRHPPLGDYPGKQEIFRVQWGEAYLYLPGDPESHPRANPPSHRKPFCTVWHEVILRPGGQLICPPNTWHWFQAGAQGAVIWSFSSQVTDAQDQFTDPQVVRKTVIADT